MEQTLTAVLVGCGSIAGAWLEAIKPFEDLRIIGLVDLEVTQANKRKEEFQLAHAVTGTDLSSILKQTKPDLVFDCTIPEAHKEVTCTALELGCHVLGEKPMADTMEHAQIMLKTADKSKRTYAVIQNRRYDASILRFRNTLRQDGLGSLTTLNADFYIGAHFGGFRDEMMHVLLLDMAIHSFDQARLISGCDPVAVYCHEWNPKGSWYHHGASAVVIFEMTQDVVFTYRGSWCATGLNTSWECNWRAICENGTVLWDGNDTIKGAIASSNEGFIRPEKEIPVADIQITHSGHQGVIRDFLDHVKAGTKPQTDCTDNIKSLAMVHAAIESATKKQRVSVHWDK